MKAKLKDPLMAQKKGFGYVKTTLKKLLREDIKEPTSFFYDSEFDYGGADGEKPILFIGELPTVWKSYVKKRKTEKTLVAGECLFEDGMLSLEVVVGKGGKELVLKDVYKALLKPFAKIQFVESVQEELVETKDGEDKKEEDDENYDTSTKDQYLEEAKGFIEEAGRMTEILNGYIEELGPAVEDISSTIVTDKLIKTAINALVAVHNLDVNSFVRSANYWILNVPKDLLEEHEDLAEAVKDLAEAQDLLEKTSVKMDLISKECEKLEKVQDPKDSPIPPVDSKASVMLVNRMARISIKTTEFENQTTNMFDTFKAEE